MTDTAAELREKRCEPCHGGTPPLSPERAQELVKNLHGWSLDGQAIQRGFRFKNFTETIDFVNRIAELAERENHHPDLLVQYNKLTVTLSTHAIGGLSENDFILAAKIDALTEI